MKANEPQAHPWMANSVAETQQTMLAEIGAKSISELFEQIPSDHRLKRPLDLPPQLASEAELSRHLLHTLRKNITTEDCLSFLGAGCWPHYVPAVVEEIVGRTEFLTSVWGSPQSDHGRNQAWFEFSSQLGELLDMEVWSGFRSTPGAARLGMQSAWRHASPAAAKCCYPGSSILNAFP